MQEKYKYLQNFNQKFLKTTRSGIKYFKKKAEKWGGGGGNSFFFRKSARLIKIKCG